MAGLSLGLGLGFARSEGGTPTPTPTPSATDAVNAYDATLASFDYTDAAQFEDAGGAAPTAGEAVAKAINTANPGTHDMTQATAAHRPVFTDGLTFDGTDDHMELTALPAVGAYVFTFKGTDPEGILFSRAVTSGPYTGFYQATGNNAIQNTTNTTWEIDGVVFSGDTKALHDAICDGVAHKVVLKAASGSNLDAWGSAAVGNYGISPVYGAGPIWLLHAVLDAGQADYADALTAAEALQAAQVAALGL